MFMLQLFPLELIIGFFVIYLFMYFKSNFRESKWPTEDQIKACFIGLQCNSSVYQSKEHYK